MLRTKLLAAVSALALAAVIAACDTAGPTAPTPGVPSLDLQVGNIICHVDNTVEGITDVRLQPFAQTVCTLFNQGALTPEEANGLLAKLGAAEAALQRGNINTAVNILNAFVNQAQAIFVNRNCNGTEASGVCHDLNGLINDVQHLIAQLLF